MLSSQELQRYQRHLQLPQFTLEMQESLKAAKVLVVGAGGLGGPILQYLAAAGVGQLGIADFDTVSLHNLQRQILFTTEDVGKSKAECAARWVNNLNPFVKTSLHPQGITLENAREIIREYDLVVDGCDSFSVRYLVNDACILENKTLVFGSLFQFEGQVSVFNFEDGPSYRCLYPTSPKTEESPNCSDVGVLGVLPSIIGSMQAIEALKVITEFAPPLSGELLIFNAINYQSTKLRISKNPENFKRTDLKMMSFSCTSSPKHADEISCQEANDSIDLQWLDIREDWEHEMEKIPSHHFSYRDILLKEDLPQGLDPQKKTIVYCQTGKKSLDILSFLKDDYQFEAIRSLQGGLNQWIQEDLAIDEN